MKIAEKIERAFHAHPQAPTLAPHMLKRQAKKAEMLLTSILDGDEDPDVLQSAAVFLLKDKDWNWPLGDYVRVQIARMVRKSADRLKVASFLFSCAADDGDDDDDLGREEVN